MKIAFTAEAKNKLEWTVCLVNHFNAMTLTVSSSLRVLRLLCHRGTVGPSEGNYSTPRTLAAFNQLKIE